MPKTQRHQNDHVYQAAERWVDAALRLRRLRLRSDEARRSLRAFEHAFANVRAVEYDARRLPDVQFTRLNEHYRPAVH